MGVLLGAVVVVRGVTVTFALHEVSHAMDPWHSCVHPARVSLVGTGVFATVVVTEGTGVFVGVLDTAMVPVFTGVGVFFTHSLA